MASLDDISEWVNRVSAAEPLIALQPLSQVAPLPLSLSLSPSLVAAVADESRDGKRWNRYSVRPSTAAARQTPDNHYDLAYSLPLLRKRSGDLRSLHCRRSMAC